MKKFVWVGGLSVMGVAFITGLIYIIFISVGTANYPGIIDARLSLNR